MYKTGEIDDGVYWVILKRCQLLDAWKHYHLRQNVLSYRRGSRGDKQLLVKLGRIQREVWGGILGRQLYSMKSCHIRLYSGSQTVLRETSSEE